MPRVLALILAIIASVSVSSAQSHATFTTLAVFNGTNGYAPPAQALVQGLDGNLYGTTSGSGLYNGGTVFKLTKPRHISTLYNFCFESGCADGASPGVGLIQAVDGTFYGTTEYGGRGIYQEGTFFKITPSGDFKRLYSFCSQYNCIDGTRPSCLLAQGLNGHIYGTTPGGGVNNGEGMAFESTTDGSVSTLYSFCGRSNCADGQGPYTGLTLGVDGNLYGTTLGGGTGEGGVVFRLMPDGQESVVYNFCSKPNCSDGSSPNAVVTQGVDRSFYGTTTRGGKYGFGTVFRVTASGDLTTLHSFGGIDGEYPRDLIQATDGNLYGVTMVDGENGIGTIFRVTPQGHFSTVHNFRAPVGCIGEECYSQSGLMQATDGNLYGTLFAYINSGSYTRSEVFRVRLRLSPFVIPRPFLGKRGRDVELLGQGLSTATNVAFNGIPAPFEIVSDAFIRATVPDGATSGYITVAGPNEVLKSNVPFHVIP